MPMNSTEVFKGERMRKVINLDDLLMWIKNIFSHAGIRRYGVNTAWLFAEQILRMIAGFLVGVWVARYLGPEKFGLFSYVLAFTSIFNGITKLGLDSIVVRDLVKEPGKRNIYLGTAFRLKLFAGIITFVLVLITSWFTANNIKVFLFINIISFGFIFQSFEVIDFYYQATVQAKYISIRRIIQLILSSGINVILVLIKAELIWFVCVNLFDFISLAIFSWSIYKAQNLPNFLKYVDWQIGKRLLKDSWPLILSAIAVSVYMRIDQIMIKNMLGNKETGLYSAAVRIVEIWYFIPALITQSIFPAIVTAKKTSEEVYLDIIKKLYSFMFFTALGIVLLVLIFSKLIILVLFGIHFLAAAEPLKIMIFLIVFSFWGVPTSMWGISENLQRIGLERTVITAILVVLFNFIFIPKYGLYGAAFGTILSQFIPGIVLNLLDRRTRKIAVIQLIAIIYPFLYFKNKIFGELHGK